MKIIKIYSNDPKKFHFMEFNEGFNVIIGRITDTTKSDRDCHNLGKTLLISLIDFLLLKGVKKKNEFFLTKGDFINEVFFIEIKLNDGRYLIIKRPVDTPTKISFKVNNFKSEGFVTNFDWDEENLTFDKAKNLLNKTLAFDICKKWDYRKPINYFLRTQNDFLDVFKLDKFKGGHKDWKPFMFDFLGFDGGIILEKYLLEEENNSLKEKINTLKNEAQVSIDERDKIQGLIEIKNDDKQKLERNIERFNFYKTDKSLNEQLVEELDYKIQALNSERYNLSVEINKIESSLSKDEINLDLNKLFQLYEEIELIFPNNIKNDYKKLLEFNKLTLEERRKILSSNLSETKIRLESVENEISHIEKEKEDILAFLIEKDSYEKFKIIQKRLSKVEAEIISLNDKLRLIDKTTIIQEKIEKNNEKLRELTKKIKLEIATQKHSEIRKLFNSIIKIILNTNALLSIKQNKNGNIEFEANIQNPKDLTITNEDAGNSYKKLLCMAFDLSIMTFYSSHSFYKFVYHDGALEALDDRKKILFIDYVRKMCNELNLQYIMTLIDSDLPKDKSNQIVEFIDEEITLTLHDKDDSGKLFKRSF